MREELTIGSNWIKLKSSSDIINVLSGWNRAAASCERLFQTVPTADDPDELAPMKRPRGLWKSQRSSGKPSPSELRPEDGTHDADGDMDVMQPTKRAKRDGSPENDDLDVPGRGNPAAAIEDWDDLKQLFNDVIEKYEGADVFL